MNVALYARVSTEEQALKGYSIDAQLNDLREFCQKHGFGIYDEYVDEGISARKKWQRRDEFVRMIGDVEDGKIDLILFIKLDRWFRSVADYYEVQKILDRHGVVWKCTREDYDTTTANGRLNLNIKLAIAQDEADRTSERIKFVMDNKVKNGEVITGSVPFGFRIEYGEKKTLQIDDAKMEIVRDAFSYFEKCHSNRKTRMYIGNKYGIRWAYTTFKRMLDNPMYYGEYRGNSDYCPAPFTKEYMQELQGYSADYGQWTRKAKHTYLFGGLLRCPICDGRMGGVPESRRTKQGVYYRCHKHINRGECPYKKYIPEHRIETALLAVVEKELGDHIIKVEKTPKQEEVSDTQREQAKKRMERLQDLYVDGFISKEKFVEEYTPLQEIVKRKPRRDYTRAKELLESDFTSLYQSMTKEQRRTLWRGILDGVEMSEDGYDFWPIFS